MIIALGGLIKIQIVEEVMESVNQYLKDDTKQIAKLIGQSLVRDPENRAPLSQLTRVLTRNSKI